MRSHAVFRVLCTADTASTRGISRFCTADTSGLAVFPGSLLLILPDKYFGVLYCGYCKYWQYFVRWFCECREYSQYRFTVNMPGRLGVLGILRPSVHRVDNFMPIVWQKIFTRRRPHECEMDQTTFGGSNWIT